MMRHRGGKLEQNTVTQCMGGPSEACLCANFKTLILKKNTTLFSITCTNFTIKLLGFFFLGIRNYKYISTMND